MTNIPPRHAANIDVPHLVLKQIADPKFVVSLAFRLNSSSAL